MASDQDRPHVNRWYSLAFVLILAAYGVYAAVFISKTIFDGFGTPYSALFDDAMISMTYARNLAQGNGLVWNPGERVEGFTNPLWVVLMAGFHLLPIPENWISLYVQVAGGVFFVASLYFLKKIGEAVAPRRPGIALLAVLLAAFYYPLTNWSLIGTEVSVLLLVTNASVWLALRAHARGRFEPGIYLLMGLSTLVRMDMAVLYGVVWLWLAWFDRRHLRRHLVWGAAVLVVCLGGQTLARKLYYGEWLPMTYYLKMTGLPFLARVRRGVIALYYFARGMFWPLVLFPATLGLFRRDRKVLLAGLVFLGYCAYSAYVGGDAWEHRGGANRFVALGMPVFFLLFSLAAVSWVDWLLSWAKRRLPRWVSGARLLTGVGLAGFVVLSLLMMNRLVDNGNPISNLRNPAEGALRFFLLQERSIYVPGNERYTRDGLLIRRFTTPEARIAVVAAGNTPYFAHRYAIDLLGKGDAVIAKGAIQVQPYEDWLDVRPGHIKFNYAYSLGKLQPDVVVELRVSTYPLGERYLDNYRRVKLNGHVMYLKSDSPYILWEEVNGLREN